MLNIRFRQNLSLSLLSSDAAKAEVFDFQELFDPVFGTFAAKARLFDPAERRDFRRKHASVDAHHAALQTLCHPPNATNVSAIEIASQAKLSIIGQPQSFVVGFNAIVPLNSEGLTTDFTPNGSLEISTVF